MDILINIYGRDGDPSSIETTPAFEALSPIERIASLRTMADMLRDIALMDEAQLLGPVIPGLKHLATYNESLNDAQWDDLCEAGETAPPRPKGSHLRLVKA